MKNALLIIDVQNDFCPGGALAVAEGDMIIPPLNALMEKYGDAFVKIIATQDWHPKGHVSFASTHGKNPYDIIDAPGGRQVLWPDHCVRGTKGAAIHTSLSMSRVDCIVRKGANPGIDSYSAFNENDRTTKTGLRGYLDDLDVVRVFIAGLAFDYCVYFSAIDAAAAGFQTFVIEDLTRAVDIPPGYKKTVRDAMLAKGIRLTVSDKIKQNL